MIAQYLIMIIELVVIGVFAFLIIYSGTREDSIYQLKKRKYKFNRKDKDNG